LKIIEQKEKKALLNKQIYDELKFKQMTPQSLDLKDSAVLVSEVNSNAKNYNFKPDRQFQKRLVEQYSKKELTRNHVNNQSHRNTASIPSSILREIDSIYKTQGT